MNSLQQIGGEHYVDVRGREVTFKNSENNPYLVCNTNDLRFLFQDTRFNFDPKHAYVGFIFWGVRNIGENNSDTVKNWAMRTTRHGAVGVSSLGGEAFRSGTVVMVKSTDGKADDFLRGRTLSRDLQQTVKNKIASNVPHQALWISLFGEKYEDWISNNQYMVFTGFSWKGGGKDGLKYGSTKEWVFRSAMSQNSSMWEDYTDWAKNKHYADNADKDESRWKHESRELENILRPALNNLVRNGGERPKSNARWFRISPNHNTGDLENGTRTEIRDTFVLETLEDDWNSRNGRKIPTKPIVGENFVDELSYSFEGTSVNLNNKDYWVSKYYHKGTGGNADGHIYYFDYGNMMQVDVWFGGTRKEDDNRIRISKLIRDGPGSNVPDIGTPVAPTQPVRPAKQTQPVQPTQPAQPVKPVQPVQPNVMNNPAKPGYPYPNKLDPYRNSIDPVEKMLMNKGKGLDYSNNAKNIQNYLATDESLWKESDHVHDKIGRDRSSYLMKKNGKDVKVDSPRDENQNVIKEVFKQNDPYKMNNEGFNPIRFRDTDRVSLKNPEKYNNLRTSVTRLKIDVNNPGTYANSVRKFVNNNLEIDPSADTSEVNMNKNSYLNEVIKFVATKGYLRINEMMFLELLSHHGFVRCNPILSMGLFCVRKRYNMNGNIIFNDNDLKILFEKFGYIKKGSNMYIKMFVTFTDFIIFYPELIFGKKNSENRVNNEDRVNNENRVNNEDRVNNENRVNENRVNENRINENRVNENRVGEEKQMRYDERLKQATRQTNRDYDELNKKVRQKIKNQIKVKDMKKIQKLRPSGKFIFRQNETIQFMDGVRYY